MANLKSVIRPFETPDYSPPKVVKPSTGAEPEDNVVITVGKNGRGKTWTTSYTFSQQRYMVKQIKEKKEINPNDDPFNSNNDPFNPNDDPFNPNDGGAP